MTVEINKLDADLFLKLYTSVGMVRVIGDAGEKPITQKAFKVV